jgi:nucleoside recognition membrane protein YjiH
MKSLFKVFVLLLAMHSSASMAAPKDTLTMGMVQFPPDMHPYITVTSIKDMVLKPCADR